MTSMISESLNAKGRVLVLGATGQLGHILRLFWPQPDDLVLHSRTPRAGFVASDLLAPSRQALEGVRDVRAVICLSGITPARSSADLSLNGPFAAAAIRLGAELGAQRVFCASSAAVYGSANGPLCENTKGEKISPYGLAKLQMEQAALEAAAALGQAATMLRIGNVAGADAILKGWHADMALDQFEDGTTPSRSYIGPLSLAAVICALTQFQQTLPDTLNLAAPRPVQMGDLLDAAGLRWRPRQAPKTAIKSVHLDTEALENYVRFAQQDSTATGLVAQWRELKKTGTI